jgi:hypothetical protein
MAMPSHSLLRVGRVKDPGTGGGDWTVVLRIGGDGVGMMGRVVETFWTMGNWVEMMVIEVWTTPIAFRYRSQ